MTFKELKKQMDDYDEACKTSFWLYADHCGNKAKIMYYDANNRERVAFSALFNAYNLIKSGDHVDSETIEDSISSFNELLNNQNFMKENFNLTLNGKSILNSGIELSGIEDFKEIYSSVFKGVFELREKDFNKMMKYVEKKISEFNNIYKKTKKEDDEKTVKQLICDINNNYFIFNKDKLKRKNTVQPIGTSSENIKTYENLITKEQIKYELLISAIKNVLNKTNDEAIEEDILTSYANLDAYPDEKKFYLDNDAYSLGQRAFDFYDENYKNVFLLSKNAKNKLNKNLKNHLS